MKDYRFSLRLAVLIFCQFFLCAYCGIGKYISISILPAIALCYPSGRKYWVSLLSALACGLLVDGLADGVIGLNAVAFIPVMAIARRLICIFIDEDIIERHYRISMKQYGILKVGLCLTILSLLFFTVYVTLDCAGTCSFGIVLLKILLSTLVSLLFCLPSVYFLTGEDERR